MLTPPAQGRRQTAVVTCPKSMVGRVIGRNGETIKALQNYTGALIQIDQTCDPTRIAISGAPQSLSLALSMVNDVIRGTFKGFALLRQATSPAGRGPQQLVSRPVYAPGYGLLPPSQLYGETDPSGSLAGMASLPGMLLSGAAHSLASSGYPQVIGNQQLPQLGPGAQYVLQGMQPMQTLSAVPGPAVYNMMGPYGTPVYLSPLDFPAASQAAATANAADMILYSDGSSALLGGGGAGNVAGASGSRLFHSSRAAAAAAAAGAGGYEGGAGGAADIGATCSIMAAAGATGPAVFTQLGGGATAPRAASGSGPAPTAGPTAALLQAGALAVDPEASRLYGYERTDA